MAAKGYVVLYPNPRGSTTYGQEFGNVIQYHYPGDDFKDLMAGVDEVLKRGYIDDKKLGVTGGSGGGGGDLDQFESWNKGVFPDEFRIQSQSRTLPQRVTEGFKRTLVGHIRQRWIEGCHQCLILSDGRWRLVTAEARYC